MVRRIDWKKQRMEEAGRPARGSFGGLQEGQSDLRQSCGEAGRTNRTDLSATEYI